MSELLNEISKIGIVPVVVLEDADKAVGVAKALQKGGINCAEVTFRTAAAEESIKNIYCFFCEFNKLTTSRDHRHIFKISHINSVVWLHITKM